MRFSLRTLLLVTSLLAVCVISLAAYQTWRFQFVPKPTEFALYLSDADGIVQSKINSNGNSFEIPIMIGEPLHLFLECKTFHANNNGELGFSIAGAPITVEVGNNGELNYAEKNHTFDVTLDNARSARTIRTIFNESYRGQKILRIGVSTNLLGNTDNMLHKQYNELTLAIPRDAE